MSIAIASGPFILPLNTVPTVRVTITGVTGDTSYPTNGSPLTAAQLGLSTVATAICLPSSGSSNNTAIGATYDTVNSKLKTVQSSSTSPVAAIESANAANQSGQTITVIAFGV